MRTNSSLKRRAAMVLAAAATSLGLVAVASPAMATTTHAPCTWGDMCYYYHSNYSGSQTGVYDWQVNDLSSPAVYFSGSGDGNGQKLWNDAGSGYNADQYFCVGVYYHANQGTPVLKLGIYGSSNYDSSTLGVVNNENRSQLFYSC